MSADNFAHIAQHPTTGRWHILDGFASDDGFNPLVHETLWFEAENDALNYAFGNYYEYGVSSGEWPQSWREFTECPTCHDCTLIVQCGNPEQTSDDA